MATIRKRNGKWQVRIKRAGTPEQYKTFHRKADADQWARRMESEADRVGFPTNLDTLRSKTVADLISRYEHEVVIYKRAAQVEGIILKVLKRQPFAKLSLANLSPEPFATYRDKRLRAVKPATVCREIGLLHHVFKIAITEWGVPLQSNPLANVRKPKISNRRERRVTSTELERIEREARPDIWHLTCLALETAMRRGEMLNISWQDVDWTQRVLHIPQTKNGTPRTIPLTDRALWILKDRWSEVDGSGPFPLSAAAVRLSWDRTLRRAGINNLRFHDLRHEAISRFFEKGLSVPEVALISGHKDYRMLFRYTHLRAQNILRKL